ncbi:MULTISPECIES: hypothetical protein [Vibrio]|uniref:hypothetical protein n=1 Tax=Vibrio TaxID=662 RepID=UPI0022323E48|nr:MULTISPECIES: hypothetical protein [Vibrio]MDV5034827.1 hypothetical protein [Vibrio diabolicus]BDR21129.1 hypothetical protein VspSTUT16_44750 [Vibrio sp. STUT-A16]
MSRISLFEFKVDMSIRDIANAFLDMRYAQNKKSGFMLGRVAHDHILVKHVTEVVSERTITNPFGETESTVVQEFLVNELEVREGLVKVVNPSRSLHQLKHDLSSSMNYRCSLSPLQIDLKSFAKRVPELMDGAVSVIALNVMSKDVMSESSVKMSVSSNKCVLKKTYDYFEGHSFEIKKLKIQFKGLGTVELSDRGTMKLGESTDEGQLFKFVSEHFIANLLSR